jgi:hypothetical protein
LIRGGPGLPSSGVDPGSHCSTPWQALVSHDAKHPVYHCHASQIDHIFKNTALERGSGWQDGFIRSKSHR